MQTLSEVIEATPPKRNAKRSPAKAKVKPPPAEIVELPLAPEMIAANATIAKLQVDLETRDARIAELEARVLPPLEPHIPLKLAAGRNGVLYNRALRWLNRQLLDAIKRGGRHFVTESSLVTQRIFWDGQ